MVAIKLLLLLTTQAKVAAFIVDRVTLVQRSHHQDLSRPLGKRKEDACLQSSSSPIQEQIRYIAGRRALILHPPLMNRQKVYPPLVILGGMAQSISSWEFHLQQLCSTRSVMIYEALGQGPPPPSEVCSIDGREVTLQQYYTDVTLERQGKDFWEVVDEAFYGPDAYYNQNFVTDDTSKKLVDLAGFSFGGRVAMAAATIQPGRIRKLHLTGVGAERDEYANIILASWKEILGTDSPLDASYDDRSEVEEECDPDFHSSRCTYRLRAFAWSIILATYSAQFLASVGSKRVQSWVDGVCKYNTEEGLKAILMQTHGSFASDLDNKQVLDSWTPAAMATRISTGECVASCKVLVGSNDKMATQAQARKLATVLGLSDDHFQVIDGCSHAVPMEAQKLWREDLIKFLDR
jgi:pimeloyl-ACP methyl ester carboxylesterase